MNIRESDLDYVIDLDEVLDFMRLLRDEMKKFKHDSAYQFLVHNLEKLEKYVD